MGEWISVIEKLPAQGQSVLLYWKYEDKFLRTTEGCIGIGGISGHTGLFQLDDGDMSILDVTHWMPLPEEPKD